MGRLLRITKARPDICADVAVSGAGEQRFEIGEPDIVGPLLGADARRVRATIIRATDQEIAHAGCAHFAKRDFLGAFIQRLTYNELGRRAWACLNSFLIF